MLYSRREAIGTILSASASSLLPSSTSLGSKLSSDAAPPPPGLDPLRLHIQQAIAQGKATGVALAVASHGSIVLEEGFGWANRDAGAKVSPHTPFSLASITKPFTATALMTLAAEGRLDLDAPANMYLADSPIQGAGRHPEAVTVRMLGAHASGLPGIFQSYDHSEAAFAPDPKALLRAYGQLAYPPSACYEYSNVGFAALDAIASHLTAIDLATLMQQRVLAPLGLHDSFFHSAAARRPSAAVGYDPSGRPIPDYVTSTPASGELFASAHDLARFAMFTMKNHLPDQQRILQDHWIDALLQPVFVGPSGVATTFGWFTGHLPSGAQVVFKSGGQPGVATILYMVPSKNFACLALTNQSNARELALYVCDQLATHYLPEWQQPQETSGPAPSPFADSSKFHGHWAGTLSNDGISMPVALTIESTAIATFALGSQAPAPITSLRLEGDAFTGNTTGSIESANARRTHASTLGIKLLVHEGKLLGRLFATAGDPDIKNVRLPYVLTLQPSVSS